MSFKVRFLCLLCRSSLWLLGINFTIMLLFRLFLRSVDIAARDFLEQNGLTDLIKLVVEENKVQFYGYNCFSFYDRFKSWTIRIRPIDTSIWVDSAVLFDWACWKERYKVSLNSKTHFTCGKPNAYIANTLMDYFYPMHTACFDLLDQNGWKSGEIY